MSSGIDALKELFNVSESRKAYNMIINFQSCNLNYDDIFDMRTKIVEVSFESLIKNYDYVSSRQEPPIWTNAYLQLTKQQLPNNYQWSLRLFLDTNRMLAFKVSISKIVRMIKDKAPPNIVVVPSPMSIGIIDLYPNEDEIDRQFGPNSSLLFLSVAVLPIIQEFAISGIKGVEAIFPMSHPILSIVLEEIPVEINGNQFYLTLSRSQMRKTGLGLPQLQKLFDLADIQILSPEETGTNPEDGVYVVMPEQARNEKGGYKYPLKYVKDLLNKEEKKMSEREQMIKQEALTLQDNPDLSEEEIRKLQAKAKGYIAEESDFYKASKCWYAETNGKNFIEVIKLPEVNPYYTYSNDFHEISEILGIEATRTLLIMEFKNVLLQDEYINSRHISLIVDVMTNLGRLTAISFYGASRFGLGAMSLSTNQQTMKVFTQAAAFGKKEKVDTVSASIMLGKTAPIGAGFVTVLPDKSKIPPPQPNPVQFSQTIDQTYKLLEEVGNEQVNQTENNQQYTNLISTILSNPIYGKETKSEPTNTIKSELNVNPINLMSPNVVKVAEKVSNEGIEVIGEVALMNTKTQDPESKNEITKLPMKRNETKIEKTELVIPSKQEQEKNISIPPSLIPPSISLIKKQTKEQKEQTAKQTVSRFKSRLADLNQTRKNQEEAKEATKATTNVEDSIKNLQNL
jgi:hypothetical protein